MSVKGKKMKFKHGDIFTFQLPTKKYMFGRIMLDIHKQCIKPKLIEPNSPLMSHGRSLLVEVYKEVSDLPNFSSSEVLIPGFYLLPDPLKSGEWQIVGHQEIDPRLVEFPETLIRDHGFWCLERGELRMTVTVDWGQERKSWHIFPTTMSPYSLANFCLYQLGYHDLLKPIAPKGLDYWSLKSIDVRYAEIRHEIYQMIGEDEKLSYYEISTQWGCNLITLYELTNVYE